MGFRFRRSIGIAPGVRINLGKNSISTSVGVRGAQITSGTHGTRTTIGAPGTGVSYTETTGARRAPVASGAWQNAFDRIETIQNEALRNVLRTGCLVLMYAWKLTGAIVLGVFIALIAMAFGGRRR